MGRKFRSRTLVVVHSIRISRVDHSLGDYISPSLLSCFVRLLQRGGDSDEDDDTSKAPHGDDGGDDDVIFSASSGLQPFRFGVHGNEISSAATDEVDGDVANFDFQSSEANSIDSPLGASQSSSAASASSNESDPVFACRSSVAASSLKFEWADATITESADNEHPPALQLRKE